MNKSKIKTWFKRNGFKPDYGAFRANWQYCHKDGRHYRIRDNEDGVGGFVVDTSDLDFDRWANSTEVYAQPVSEFIVKYDAQRTSSATGYGATDRRMKWQRQRKLCA